MSEQDAQLRFLQKLNGIRQRDLEQQALEAEINRTYDPWFWGWPGHRSYCRRYPGNPLWCY